MIHIFRLLRHGDQEGLKETHALVQEANETRRRLRRHIEENHLSEALGLVFAPVPPPWYFERKKRQ